MQCSVNVVSMFSKGVKTLIPTPTGWREEMCFIPPSKGEAQCCARDVP